MLTITTSSPPSCRSLLPAKSPVVSPDRRITKKYRRAYIRKLKEREYRRLRAVVPALAHRDRVTKVAVIEEAIKYIDELHQALVERVQTENDYPVDPEVVTTVAQQIFSQAKSQYSSSYTNCPTVLSERNGSQHTTWRGNRNGDHNNS